LRRSCAVSAHPLFAGEDSRNIFETRTYPWYGQLVVLEREGPDGDDRCRIPAYIEAYIKDFKNGDRLVIVWNMIGKTEATQVIALWKPTTANDTGYVLPITFVSADASKAHGHFQYARAKGRDDSSPLDTIGRVDQGGHADGAAFSGGGDQGSRAGDAASR
jgi:hypothetical protein